MKSDLNLNNTSKYLEDLNPLNHFENFDHSKKSLVDVLTEFAGLNPFGGINRMCSMSLIMAVQDSTACPYRIIMSQWVSIIGFYMILFWLYTSINLSSWSTTTAGQLGQQLLQIVVEGIATTNMNFKNKNWKKWFTVFFPTLDISLIRHCMLAKVYMFSAGSKLVYKSISVDDHKQFCPVKISDRIPRGGSFPGPGHC